jgi:hypothetical protein
VSNFPPGREGICPARYNRLPDLTDITYEPLGVPAGGKVIPSLKLKFKVWHLEIVGQHGEDEAYILVSENT